MTPNAYQAAYDYLRMATYQAATSDWNVTELKRIAAQCNAALFSADGRPKQVTITATSSEAGGMASGEVTYPAALALQVVMDLLREVAPDSLPPEAPSGTVSDFSRRYISP